MAQSNRPLAPLRTLRACLALAAAAVIAIGCSAGRVAPSDAVIVTDDGLELLAAEGPGSVYIRRPRPRLDGFDKVMLDSVYISYGKRAERRRSAEEGALANHFRDTILRELGWTLVEEPGADVFRLQLGALDMDLSDEELGGETSTVIASAGGTVKLVMDLRYSVEDEPLFRFVQQRRLPGGLYYDSTNLEFERVKRSIDRFVRDSRERIEQFYGPESEIAPVARR